MRTTTGTHYSHPAIALDAAAREQLVDALHAAGSPASCYVRVVGREFEPLAPELDLVIQTTSARTARDMWATWALAQDLDGQHRVEVIFTSPLPAGRKRRQREESLTAVVDLDMIVLEAELAELDAADRALGL